MNNKTVFGKILNKLSGIMCKSASVCGMGTEKMPECLKKLR